MSKFVNEIIQDIKKNRNNWTRTSSGIYSAPAFISVNGYGSNDTFSIEVFIDRRSIPITYTDKVKLEKAVEWWYSNVDLNQIKK